MYYEGTSTNLRFALQPDLLSESRLSLDWIESVVVSLRVIIVGASTQRSASFFASVC